MRIINFVKHNKEKPVGFRGSRKEIASFDIEFKSLECVLTWTGWSIRKLKDESLALQAPLKCFSSTESREPAIKIDKLPSPLFLKLLRSQIKTQYGIEIPEPEPKKSANPPDKRRGSAVGS